MKAIDSVTAWYPLFEFGGSPVAVECQISVVEAMGERYLRTPFSFVRLKGPDSHRSLVNNRGFFDSEAACLAFLEFHYPRWKDAEPIMNEIVRSKRWSHFGDHEVADRIGVTIDSLYKIARGSRAYSAKQIKSAVARLNDVPSRLKA